MKNILQYSMMVMVKTSILYSDDLLENVLKLLNNFPFSHNRIVRHSKLKLFRKETNKSIFSKRHFS